VVVGVNANLRADLLELERLHGHRRQKLERVSTLKHKLSDLEQTETEEIGEMDFERSLLSGELESEAEKVRKIKSRLSLLRIQEQRLSGVFEEWQKLAAGKMKQAQIRIEEAEEKVEVLEVRVCQASAETIAADVESCADDVIDGGGEESEDGRTSAAANDAPSASPLPTLVENLKYQREVLELERKTFEDMEFHQMEEEVHKQTEREELLKEIGELERECKRHEKQLFNLESQQRHILDSVRRDTAILENQRQQVIAKLDKEKQQLEFIESKIKALSLVQQTRPTTNDVTNSANATADDVTAEEEEDSCDEEETMVGVRNMELAANLRRLELLDKTQDEIEKLSRAVIKLKDESNSISHKPQQQRCHNNPVEWSQKQQRPHSNSSLHPKEQRNSRSSSSSMQQQQQQQQQHQINYVQHHHHQPLLSSNKSSSVFNPHAQPAEFSAARLKGSSLIVLQQQKQIAEELNKVIKAMSKDHHHRNTGGSCTNNKMVSTKQLMIGAATAAPTSAPSNNNNGANSLNSAGSEEGSVCTTGSISDLHTESLSTSNEFMAKPSGSVGTPSPIQRSDKQLRHCEPSSSSSGQLGAEDMERLSDQSSAGGGDTLADDDFESAVSSINGGVGAGGGGDPEADLFGHAHRRHQTSSAAITSSYSAAGHHPHHDFVLDCELSSRPVSEASSVWDEAESQMEVKRRHNQIQKQQRPLTRYLPIRGENLDLRSHIETAGHQLEMIFPSVVIDSMTCRGYLHKLGGSGLSAGGAGSAGVGVGKRHSSLSSTASSKFPGLSHSWNKRWFVFDRNKKTLVYCADKHESKAKGGVYFSAIEEVYVDHLNAVKSPNPKVTFVIKTFERTYYLMAPSPEAMRVWVDVIFTGAEGYQQFQ